MNTNMTRRQLLDKAAAYERMAKDYFEHADELLRYARIRAEAERIADEGDNEDEEA